MQYRRNEGFRFQFEKPVKGLFSIIRRNGKQVQSRSGSVTVIDISPNGLRFQSPLELPIETNQKIEINVSFTINSTKLSYNGTILWKRPVQESFQYGILLENEEDERQGIIDEIKLYQKRLKKE